MVEAIFDQHEKSSSGDESEFDQNNFGKCSVCWMLINGEVMMCPDCSGIICTECLGKLPKQARRHRCAKCRQYGKDFVRVRFAEEMISSSMFRKKDICKVHELEKVFYCENCAKAVCPVCFYEVEIH